MGIADTRRIKIVRVSTPVSDSGTTTETEQTIYQGWAEVTQLRNDRRYRDLPITDSSCRFRVNNRLTGKVKKEDIIEYDNKRFTVRGVEKIDERLFKTEIVGQSSE
jgi:hypothetical protein